MPTFFVDSKAKVQTTFEEHLRNLGVDYLDRYLLHSIYSTTYDSKILAYDTPEVLDRMLSKHPETDFVQLVVNYYDWDSPLIQSRCSYEVARRYCVKIFIMEPVKGGLLAKLPAPIHKSITKT